MGVWVVVIIIIIIVLYWFRGKKIKDMPGLVEFTAPSDDEALQYMKAQGFKYYSKKDNTYLAVASTPEYVSEPGWYSYTLY